MSGRLPGDWTTSPCIDFLCTVRGLGDDESPVVITHAPDCPVVGRWAWPIPPEHAGPCACKRMEGTRHFTEHTPHGCSMIPGALAEALLAATTLEDYGGVDEPIADELLADLEAVGAHAAAAYPEIYGRPEERSC